MSALAPAFLTYLVMAASPGPGNLTIGAVAARHGRAAGLVFAAGLLGGGLTWALLAATGISALLSAIGEIMTVLKIGCAVFLLWLSWRSARAALSRPRAVSGDAEKAPGLRALARRGYLLQVSNPKSILTWAAVMALGLHAGSGAQTSFVIIAGCEVIGAAVFGGYALLFALPVVARGYRRAYRFIEASLAGFFAFAGIRLLIARNV